MAKRQRVLVDTSIQIGKFKYKEIRDHIKEIAKTEDPGTSFFVLFEFKVGLVLSFIEYWDLLNISSDVPRAINKWSEQRGQRDPKYFMLLQAIILENFGSSSSDKKRHMRQVQFAIFHVINNFFTGIKNVAIGDFRYDEIVRYEINSKEEYPGFSKLCSDRKRMADQRPFWSKYADELNSLVQDADLKKKYESMHEALTLIQGDIKYAHMVNSNRAVGDAVIAVDARPDTRILTTDKSFEIIAPILSKTVERIPNKY